jgi:cytochrome c-type biogenesis protein
VTPAVDAPGWGLAFAAGLISSLSPCVLPLIPVYMAYVSGVSVQGAGQTVGVRSTFHTLNASLLFVLGFTFVFVALGTSASLLGGLLEENQRLLYQISGGLMIAMGLLMTGFLRPSLLNRDYRPALNAASLGSAGPVLFGMAFALGWTPCVGPVLASILFYAGTSETAGQGGLLLLVYSLGFGLPLVIGALAWSHGMRLFSGLQRWYGAMTLAGGVLMILVGVLFIADQWYRVNIWTDRLLG